MSAIPSAPRLTIRRFLRAWPLLGTALLLPGCTVGPDYHAPKVALGSQWLDGAGQGEFKADNWWTKLGDPLLNSLVDEMLAHNPNLQEAQARLAEARAARDAVRGAAAPQVQMNGGANEVLLSKNGQIPLGRIPGFAREMGLFDLGFDASWEIDLWGRQTRTKEGAAAREAQAALAMQGVRLQLIAELARAYVDLRLAQHEQQLASDALDARNSLAKLTRLRARAGESSQIDAALADSDLDAAQAAHAQSEAVARAAALRVIALVGTSPADLLTRLEVKAPIPAPPRAIAVGLPSDLLQRRPDIRVAERALAAASADVGVATADLFPRLRLGLSVGQQARSIAGLFDNDSTRLQAGPGLAWPVFSGGSVRARIHMAGARVDQAAAHYDAAVIEALTDSEAAINRFDRAIAAMTASDQGLQRDQTAFALIQQRVAAGEDDQLSLARARLVDLAARQRGGRARAAAASAAIALYKALGGGWDSGADTAP